MNVTVRKYEEKDLPDLIRIWNEVVEDGVAFRLWPAMFLQDIFMRDLDLPSLA